MRKKSFLILPFSSCKYGKNIGLIQNIFAINTNLIGKRLPSKQKLQAYGNAIMKNTQKSTSIFLLKFIFYSDSSINNTRVCYFRDSYKIINFFRIYIIEYTLY